MTNKMKTAKLIERTIKETLDEEGNLVQTTTSVTSVIMDGENEVGRVNASEWNVNANINNGGINVEAIHDVLVDELTKEEGE